MATLSAERRSATRPGNSAYDELDRPLGILPVSNGRPVLFSYRPDEIQLESETDNSYSYRFEHDYDDLGRVARKTHTRMTCSPETGPRRMSLLPPKEAPCVEDSTASSRSLGS
jgi:hypothetical protein